MPPIGFAAAVSILTELAFSSEQPSRSEELAFLMGMDGGVTRRLLAKLSRAGLVRIRRGPGGGAWLRKWAGEITLFHVWEAIADSRSPEQRQVRIARVCRMRRHLGPVLSEIMEDARRMQVDFLGGHSIAAIAQRITELDRERAYQLARERRAAAQERAAGGERGG